MNMRLVTAEREARATVAQAAGLTGLPRLIRIPAMLPLRPELAEWAKLALWCDDAGLVKPCHWQGAYNAQAVVLSALNEWVASSGLKKIGCTFSIGMAEGEFPGDSYDQSDWTSVLAERGHDAAKPHLCVWIQQGGMPSHYIIGPTLLAVEAECPGLASTALNMIRRAANDTLDVIDPARIMALASQTYWYGEENEKLFLEEVGEDIEDLDDFVTRAKFDEHAPQWAWFPKSGLSIKALSGIAKDDASSARVRAIADASLSLMRIVKCAGLPSPCQGLHSMECMGVAACLWWGDVEDRLMERVWDDYEQQLMNGGDGYFEGHGLDTFEATQAGFDAWLKQKTQWLEVARGLETLIGLVGQEIKND